MAEVLKVTLPRLGMYNTQSSWVSLLELWNQKYNSRDTELLITSLPWKKKKPKNSWIPDCYL